MKKFLFILGTRPEIIKIAPVVLESRKHNDIIADILHTGQHKELAEEMFEHFGISPTYNLAVMQENQTLYELTARIAKGIGDILADNKYDMIFVQGDTTTAFVGALCGFYSRIPVAHIEAGLRTQNKYSPFPEEINRRLVSPIATLHFPPTQRAANMLLNEGIDKNSIIITGNTVIDALLWSIDKEYKLDKKVEKVINMPGRLVLVTTHRRESFGEPHRQIFKALLQLADKFDDINILLPMHPNPNVRKEIKAILNGHPRINLTEPLNYRNFISAMKKSTLIMSDSGGVQEEAPSLNKPVLVLRDTTERPEGLTSGALKLVGTNTEVIVNEATKLLTDKQAYEAMANAENPYGDGHASERIIKAAFNLLKA